MEAFKIELTEQELEMVYTGLLELPAKMALPVIHKIKGQTTKDGVDESSDQPQI